MGRTVLPYSVVLEAEYSRWKNFRRALRKEDQQLFDELFELARRHMQAGANSSMPVPLQPVFMSMLIELLRINQKLELKLQLLETFLDAKGD
jgi:hypothetical protein